LLLKRVHQLGFTSSTNLLIAANAVDEALFVVLTGVGSTWRNKGDILFFRAIKQNVPFLPSSRASSFRPGFRWDRG
jgi:hypothetical protein